MFAGTRNRVGLLEPATSRFRGNHLARVGRLARAEALSLDAGVTLTVAPCEINGTRHTNGYGVIPAVHFNSIRFFAALRRHRLIP